MVFMKLYEFDLHRYTCYVKLMIIYCYILQQIFIPLFFGVGNHRVPRECNYYALTSINNT
jgi:hypothetical protein